MIVIKTLVITVLQFFLHHPDNGKRGTVDMDGFPDGALTAKEILRHIPTQESHPTGKFHIIRIDKSTAILGDHVSHKLERIGHPVHQPVGFFAVGGNRYVDKGFGTDAFNFRIC